MYADQISKLLEGTYAETLGVRVIEAHKERVELELDMRPELSTSVGGVHGGVLMGLADIAGAMGATLNLPPGTRTTTAESKQNFMGSLKSGAMRAIAVPIHIGARTSIWRTEVREAATERLLAHVVQTQMILPADL